MVHRIALALQGGGSHGAFTWGVLHRLLDGVAKDRLAVAALSGSSAGAVNGALCAYGLSDAGAHRATDTQELLSKFWTTLSARSLLQGNPFSGSAAAYPWSGWNIDCNPVAIALEAMALVFSPYSFPFYTNPLASLLHEFLPASAIFAIDGATAPQLHVCAVNVGNNRRKLFARPALSVDTCWRQRACRNNSASSASAWTSSTIGTVGISVIRHSRRWSSHAPTSLL
jgi:NTE family protein